MKTITIDDVLKLKPCEGYDRERLEEMAGGKEEWSAGDILKLRIPHDHKIWVILQAGFMDPKKMILFAADCAEHVLHVWEDQYPNDIRPRKAIEAARESSKKLSMKIRMARGAAQVRAPSLLMLSAEAAARAAEVAAAAAASAAAVPAWEKGTEAVARMACVARQAAEKAMGTIGLNKERAWQMERLRHYLGEADE